jgi:hypothetical protein
VALDSVRIAAKANKSALMTLSHRDSDDPKDRMLAPE